MIPIATVIAVDSKTLKSNLRKVGVPIPKSRHELVLRVCSYLAEKNSLLEADFLTTPYFVQVYRLASTHLSTLIEELFPNLNNKNITRLQAVCLICMQIQAEPFASYLARHLTTEAVQQIYSFGANALTDISLQTVISQGLLAKYSRNAEGLKSNIAESSLASLLEKQQESHIDFDRVGTQFIPQLFTISVWEQATTAAALCVKLRKYYPYAPYIRRIDLDNRYICHLELSIPETARTAVSVIQYLQDNPARQSHVYRKLVKLFQLLKKHKLFIEANSLGQLHIDIYENIWIFNIINSRRAKGMGLANEIDNIAAAWNKELKRKKMSKFDTRLEESSQESGTTSESDSEDITEDYFPGITNVPNFPEV